MDLVRDSIDDLSEDFQKEYVKDTEAGSKTNGKFVLQWAKGSGALEVDDVGGLKTTVGTLRAEAREHEKQLARFKGIDDPTEAVAALQKVSEMKNWDPDKEVKERIAAREADLLKRHKTEIESRDAKLASATGQLEKHLIEAAATAALTKAGAGKRLSLALPHVRDHVRMRELDDGRFVAEVIDANGNPRIGDTEGNAMTISQLVGEMKENEDFGPIFDGTGNSGGGAAGGGDDNAKKSGGGGGSGTGKVIGASKLVGGGIDPQDILDGKVSVEMGQ